MSTTSRIKYPLDLTGVHPDNKVTNELHEITPQKRIITPKHGFYYSDSLQVHWRNNRLVEGVDYYAIDLNDEATKRTGKSVMTSIRIVSRKFTADTVSITYQCYGSSENYSVSHIEEMVRFATAERQVYFKDIIGLPATYAPDPHRHPLTDVYGFRTTNQILMDITSAILSLRHSRDHRLYALIARYENAMNRRLETIEGNHLTINNRFDAFEGYKANINTQLTSFQNQLNEFRSDNTLLNMIQRMRQTLTADYIKRDEVLGNQIRSQINDDIKPKLDALKRKSEADDNALRTQINNDIVPRFNNYTTLTKHNADLAKYTPLTSHNQLVTQVNTLMPRTEAQQKIDDAKTRAQWSRVENKPALWKDYHDIPGINNSDFPGRLPYERLFQPTAFGTYRLNITRNNWEAQNMDFHDVYYGPLADRQAHLPDTTRCGVLRIFNGKYFHGTPNAMFTMRTWFASDGTIYYRTDRHAKPNNTTEEAIPRDWYHGRWMEVVGYWQNGLSDVNSPIRNGIYRYTATASNRITDTGVPPGVGSIIHVNQNQAYRYQMYFRDYRYHFIRTYYNGIWRHERVVTDKNIGDYIGSIQEAIANSNSGRWVPVSQVQQNQQGDTNGQIYKSFGGALYSREIRVTKKEDLSHYIAITHNNDGTLWIQGIIKPLDVYLRSDRRLKEDLRPINDGLGIIKQLTGYHFKWKENHQDDIGLIAQEIEEVLPDVVNGDEEKAVSYHKLIPVLIEAVKQLSSKVEKLEDELLNLRRGE